MYWIHRSLFRMTILQTYVATSPLPHDILTHLSSASPTSVEPAYFLLFWCL